MGAIGIVPEIVVLVKRIRIIGYALSQSKLKVSLKKIKIIMGVYTKILPQGAVVHILIYERNPRIGVVEQLLPFLIPVGLLIIT
jgi:hypothetical protein